MAFPRQAMMLASTVALTLLQSIVFPNVLPKVADSSGRSLTLAQTPPKYNPPSDRKRLQRTRGGGSRGCSSSQSTSGKASQTALSLLVPPDHVAQTVSAYPTFVWYLSNPTTYPIEFALVERDVAKPLLVKQLQIRKPGLVRFELPQEGPGLLPGKEYRWTVSLVCDADRPSQNMSAYAWIELVPPTADLTAQLAASQSHSDRSLIYARFGLWYDSLALLTSTYLQNPDDQKVSAYLSSLLNQIGFHQNSIVHSSAQ
ncbi:MAG: DUF928 domain-containing protein [Leptolyngbyaceae cyanobacterium bins.59]|nr:DUF928 domain-containing protein [Leptolyngbyaceae cyanobacterium bins.59]